MPADGFSAYVQAVDGALPVLAVNGDAARNPASTIKLLTTFVALRQLGPAYRWQTRAYLDAPPENGVAAGDLYLEGRGDPYLVTERLWLFIRQMRQRGLEDVRGDLVIDNSYFALEPADPGAFDGQAYRTYNVVPDALLVNFNAIRFIFQPDPVSGRVDIIADPSPANLGIDNELRLGPGRCGGYQNGISVSLPDTPAHEVVFSGRYGRSCTRYSLSRSVMPAPEHAYGVFKSLWHESGGTLAGGLRTAVVPDGLEPFASLESPTLAELIRAVNKWSNNVMTRHILLTMGAEASGAPATVDKGRMAVTWALAEIGLDMPELYIDNGSGLSRQTRISARNLARALLAAHDDLYHAEFKSSLALAGLDGTMRRRFRNSELTGRMHMKTGRLDDVFAMAGYLRSRSGRNFVVAAIHNETGAHKGPGEEAVAALLKWVYRQ